MEQRLESIDVGFERLRVAAEELFDRDVPGVADGLLQRPRDPEGRDDVALVVKRVTGPS